MPEESHLSSESVVVLQGTQAEREKREELILEALRTYSPSGEERGFALLLKRELEDHGLSAEIDSVGNVICEFGSGEKSILLCGHMDTVPGILPVKREDGRVYGRGACDAKGPLMSLLFAFEDLSTQKEIVNAGRVIFAGVTEEERSSAGVMELLKNNVQSDYAIFGEPCGVDRVTIGYRGHLMMRVEIVTPEAHSSAPWLATNSAVAAFEYYSNLVRTWNSRGPEKSLDSISVSLTEIHSGSAHNVNPGRTTMTLDIRIPLGKDSRTIRTQAGALAKEMESKYTDAKFSLAFDEPSEPYRAKMSSELVKAINRAILKEGHEKTKFINKSATGDMNVYALTFGSEAVTYGPGETRLSHSSNEMVSLDELFACTSVVKRTVGELFLR